MLNAISGKSIARLTLALFVGLLFAVFFISPAQAAAATYATTVTSLPGNGTLTMEPGERTVVSVTFKNTGTGTWHNYGEGYVSVYTHGPKYRRSVFDPGTWMGPTQLKPIAQRDVAPGGEGTVSFELHAPKEAGTYTETFQLASEDRAWVEGGSFTFTIHVEEGIPTAISTPGPVAPQGDGYAAELTFVTANKVKAVAGRSILLSAIFKNTGKTTWSNYALVAPDVSLASDTPSFSDVTWDGAKLVYVASPVAPGDTAVVNFSLRAPEINGTHIARFHLAVDGIDLEDALIELPVEVTGGAASIVNEPIREDIVETEDLIEQPDIRIGVLIVDDETDNEVHVTSHESAFALRDTEGNMLAQLNKDQVVRAYYKAGSYYFDIGRGLEQSLNGLRFEPATENAVMTIENFDKRVTRGSRFAENTFRGVLELRYNETKDRAWVINELPMEYYLRGLAETSDAHPEEMNKAQVVAARTYAYFYHTRDGKRQDEFMDLNATPTDQLYLGYERESRAPGIVNAVLQTAGEIVTYAGEVAITPYYARSNGRTKDWGDVWWGDQPHVRGVAVPCDVGKTQWGHGVGMPQSGAKCLADDGKTYKEILNYFFTGIDITKKWN